MMKLTMQIKHTRQHYHTLKILIMNYSTTLPTGFKTWNEFLKELNLSETATAFYNKYGLYQVDFINARALDEIMELVNYCKGNYPESWKEESIFQKYFCEDFQKLTHTNLFK